jgi:hypothetical protein
MVEADMQNSPERFYLDDLYVGQRFTSRTHVIDAAHSRHLPASSILSLSISTKIPPKTRCLRAWWRAAGTQPPLV